MESFLKTWEDQYQKEASAIALFSDAAKRLSKEQKQLFVRLFYHARAYFDHFLWIMASLAPNFEYRSVVLKNITDELGGNDISHVSHEQLFIKFAEALGVDVLSELKSKENYLPFLQEFNDGHIQALLNTSWEEKWAIFSAYELLDNADYNNLYKLALNMGLSGDALTFFEVHKHGNHFGETFKLLEKIWNTDSALVQRSFDFIGGHQLKMWNSLSQEVFSL